MLGAALPALHRPTCESDRTLTAEALADVGALTTVLTGEGPTGIEDLAARAGVQRQTAAAVGAAQHGAGPVVEARLAHARREVLAVVAREAGRALAGVAGVEVAALAPVQARVAGAGQDRLARLPRHAQRAQAPEGGVVHVDACRVEPAGIAGAREVSLTAQTSVGQGTRAEIAALYVFARSVV